jgi:hypothetical protein
VRSSPLRGDGGAALKADEARDVDVDAEVDADVANEVARALDDLDALVGQACTPSTAIGARAANLAARELLEQRKTINGLERLVSTLRSDLAVRGQSLVRSEDKRRGLEGELADLRKKMTEVEAVAAQADARAARARGDAARALADKELAIHRGEDALRRVEHRHERALAERDREHANVLARRDALLDAERAARAADEQQAAWLEEIYLDDRRAAAQRYEAIEGVLAAEREARVAAEEAQAPAVWRIVELEAALGAEREARAAEEAAHASELEAEREQHSSELVERERALGELFEQQAKVLTELERAHRAELEASERALVLAAEGAKEIETVLAQERAELAASVAAHARALIAAEEKKEEALVERDRVHLQDCRARARAHRKQLAERCAKAEEKGQAAAAASHAGVATTMQARIRDAEQSLAVARAKHAREVNELKLEIAGLKESAAAEHRLAEHAKELHGRARAEMAQVCRALETAEREAAKRQEARDAALAQLDRQLAVSRDTLDESGTRLVFGLGADEGDEHEGDFDEEEAVTRAS